MVSEYAYIMVYSDGEHLVFDCMWIRHVCGRDDGVLDGLIFR